MLRCVRMCVFVVYRPVPVGTRPVGEPLPHLAAGGCLCGLWRPGVWASRCRACVPCVRPAWQATTLTLLKEWKVSSVGLRCPLTNQRGPSRGRARCCTHPSPHASKPRMPPSRCAGKPVICSTLVDAAAAAIAPTFAFPRVACVRAVLCRHGAAVPSRFRGHQDRHVRPAVRTVTPPPPPPHHPPPPTHTHTPTPRACMCVHGRRSPPALESSNRGNRVSAVAPPA